jgi:membrane AbrB-like protein
VDRTNTLIKTAFAALIGSTIFYFLHLPLPWMLGPLTGVMIWKSFGQEACWPTPVRNCGVIVLGAMMGSWFTPETARQIIVQLPGMLMVTGTSLLFGFGLAYFTARQTGISLASSLLGSTPGGLTQMTIICDEFKDADLAVVSVLQTLRLQMVIFIVPFLAIHAVAGGAAAVAPPVAVSEAPVMGLNQITAVYVLAALGGAVAGKRLSFPTPFMIGPLVGVAILGVNGLSLPQTPPLLSALSQFCMGAYMGKNIDFGSLRRQKKLLLYAVLGGLVMVASSLLSAWMLTVLYPVALTTAFLSAAPGGTAEMGLTAVMIHADVSMVSSYQIFRLLFIILVIPYFFKWWLCRSQPAE